MYILFKQLCWASAFNLHRDKRALTAQSGKAKHWISSQTIRKPILLSRDLAVIKTCLIHTLSALSPHFSIAARPWAKIWFSKRFLSSPSPSGMRDTNVYILAKSASQYSQNIHCDSMLGVRQNFQQLLEYCSACRKGESYRQFTWYFQNMSYQNGFCFMSKVLKLMANECATGHSYNHIFPTVS